LGFRFSVRYVQAGKVYASIPKSENPPKFETLLDLGIVEGIVSLQWLIGTLVYYYWFIIKDTTWA
jgi:hypothetical protein